MALIGRWPAYLDTLEGGEWVQRESNRTPLICLVRAERDLLMNYRIRDDRGVLAVVLGGQSVEMEA